MLLSPLSFPKPDQLVVIYESGMGFDKSSISYPNFLDWQRRNTAFDQIGVYRADNFNLTGSGESELIDVAMVSHEFFPVLGVKPILGRVFTKEDDVLGAARTVMLMEGYWKRNSAAARTSSARPSR